MRLLVGYDDAVKAFVADRIPQMGGPDDFGPSVGIGVMSSDGMLVGGVVFSNYQPTFGSIEVAFAGSRRNWLTPRLVSGILAYPFTQLNANRITCLTPKRNRQARQFLEKFGFKREGLIRRGFGNDDCVVSGLLRKEWEGHRFNVNGQTRTDTASGSRSDAVGERPDGGQHSYGA